MNKVKDHRILNKKHIINLFNKFDLKTWNEKKNKYPLLFILCCYSNMMKYIKHIKTNDGLKLFTNKLYNNYNGIDILFKLEKSLDVALYVLDKYNIWDIDLFIYLKNTTWLHYLCNHINGYKIIKNIKELKTKHFLIKNIYGNTPLYHICKNNNGYKIIENIRIIENLDKKDFIKKIRDGKTLLNYLCSNINGYKIIEKIKDLPKDYFLINKSPPIYDLCKCKSKYNIQNIIDYMTLDATDFVIATTSKDNTYKYSPFSLLFYNKHLLISKQLLENIDFGTFGKIPKHIQNGWDIIIDYNDYLHDEVLIYETLNNTQLIDKYGKTLTYYKDKD